jgi:Zn-dependent protease
VRYGGGFLSVSTISLAANIVFVNLFLGLFNLIPFPPLDGFTALRAGLPWNLSSGLTRIENKMRGAGVVSLIFFLIIFSYIFANPFFNLVVWLFNLLIGAK